MKKVVFITGGTGGHIYPAISIAKKMREQNIDILFIIEAILISIH